MTLEELKAKYTEVYNEKDYVVQAELCRELLDEAISYVFDYSKVKRPKKATLLELLDSRTFYDFVEDTEVIEGLHC